MYQFGHYGVALLVYAPLGTIVAFGGYETVALVGALACVALSTLPDCDHRLPLIQHRGPTHSLVFAVFVGVGLAALAALFVETASPFVDLGVVAFAFVVGTLSIGSHLLADVLTPMGIRPLWPFSRRHYTLEVTRAANPIANYVLFGLGVAAILAGVVVIAALG